MNATQRITHSSIGMKWSMALSGAFLLFFVIAHLAGNLGIYSGQETVNAYALWLKKLPFSALWILRIGTLAALIVHVGTAVRLTRLNRAARPVDYQRRAGVQTTAAAKSMVLTGFLVLAYVIYHLLHFTFGATDPENFALVDAQGRHDVYSMMVRGFQAPAVSAAYVVATAVLGVHLSHGIGSLFQTLGFHHARWTPLINKAGPAAGFLIFILYASIPVAVLAGIVTLPEGVQ